MLLVPVKEIPLLEKIRPVPFAEMEHLTSLYIQFLELQETCVQKDGVGLSAVQVGIPSQCFVARLRNEWRYFLNCSYKETTGFKVASIEGCLSFPGRFEILRHECVAVEGFELIKSKVGLEVIPINEQFSGMNSFIMQHEIDHQNGILISDIGHEIEVW